LKFFSRLQQRAATSFCSVLAARRWAVSTVLIASANRRASA
jgi:hypothetical protein